MKKEIVVNIEIPKGSKIKYEFDRKTGKIFVDRILVGDFWYPANYGFVAEALDWDGDELDVLVYSDHVFHPGVQLKARIVGAMKMIDDGETDTKLIAVHADDKELEKIMNLKDIPSRWLKEMETFFTTYKNYKRPGITSVSGFEDEAHALKEYAECVELMKNYSYLTKKEFIEKMKVMHPEKYPKAK